jgi:tetratricopeptide (TPR) repeat protein
MGLHTPDVSHPLTLEMAAGSDAIQLFVECAALKQPGFALGQKSVEVIAGICQQLDGLPLAIEMAAAQVDVLSLREIAAGLGDRFTLLANGSRTAAPRHQTLRGTLDWSYNLLNGPERALLAQLSVFRGGWTAGAAQAVCMVGDHDIASLLSKLTHCSLVACMAEANSAEMRYRLLESVRHYADEKLRLTHALTEVQDRHLAYYLGLAEEPTDIAGPQIEAWLPRIEQEIDNVRAAFAHALIFDDRGERAMRLVYAMTKYWSFIGPADEWRNWATQANRRGEQAPLWAKARGMHSMFAHHLFCGAVNEALAVGEASLALFRQTEDRLGTAWCLETLANNSNSAHVQPLAEEALHLFRALGSRDGEGRALRALGISAYWSGDSARAADLLEQSIAVAPWDLESCMGYFYFAHPQRALAICSREVDRLTAQGIVNQYPATIRIFAVLLMLDGQFEEASRHYNTVVQVVQMHRAPAHYSFACYQMLPMAMIEHALQHMETALWWLEQAHQNAEDTHSHVVAYTARFLKAAFIAADSEEDDLVLQLAQHCLRGFHQLDFALGMVCVFVLMAGIASWHGDHGQALKLLAVAKSHGQIVAHQALWMDGVLWMWHRDAQQTLGAPALAAARAALGDAEFERCYAAGQRMSLDEAVRCTL